MSESLEPGHLPSSSEGRLRQLRNDLVLQLYLKRGLLWEAVHDVRDRWNVVAKVQLPPPVVGRLLPEDAPDFDDEDRQKFGENYQDYLEYARQWDEEMSAIRSKVIPEPPLPTTDVFDYKLERSWNDFLSACVLYDPPDDQLIEFASYRNLRPAYLSDPQVLDKGINLEGRPEMVDPPVKSLWALNEVGDWYWRRILAYVSERYLESQGVDVEALLEHAMLEIPGLREERREKYEQYSKSHYIEVDEYTTLKDVKNAFQMVRSIQPPKRTKPPRDRLTAVQHAILYERHNRADPEDRRGRRWTYKKLAKHFGLKGPRAAKDHVELGNKILPREGSEER